MTGAATEGIKTVLHPVSDLEKAKAVYAALLGIPPTADAPYYVGFEAAGQHIGLVPTGGGPVSGSPVSYWHVSDLAAKLAALERKYDGQFTAVFEAIRELMTPTPRPRRPIGFRIPAPTRNQLAGSR